MMKDFSWIGFLQTLAQWLLVFFKRKKAGDAFVDAIRLFQLIDEVLKKDLKIERISIIKAHNDNGNVTPVGFKYISIQYSKAKEPLKDIRDKYQRISMEEDYYLILAQMYIKKGIDVVAGDIPEGNTRDLYVVGGVKFQKMFFLKHDKKSLWYCTFSTSIEGEVFNTAEQRSEIFLAVNKIKNLLKAY